MGQGNVANKFSMYKTFRKQYDVRPEHVTKESKKSTDDSISEEKASSKVPLNSSVNSESTETSVKNILSERSDASETLSVENKPSLRNDNEFIKETKDENNNEIQSIQNPRIVPSSTEIDSDVSEKEESNPKSIVSTEKSIVSDTVVSVPKQTEVSEIQSSDTASSTIASTTSVDQSNSSKHTGIPTYDELSLLSPEELLSTYHYYPIPNQIIPKQDLFSVKGNIPPPEFFDAPIHIPKEVTKPSSTYDLTKADLTTYFEYYANKQREIVYKKKPTRYLCFKPNVAGLGNKLLGLYTALLLAMMTDRTFCIADWNSINDYFEFSFPVPTFRQRNFKSFTEFKYGPSCGPRPDLQTTPFNTLFPTDNIIYISNCPAVDWLMKNPDMLAGLKRIGFLPLGKRELYTKLKIETFFMHYFIRPTTETRVNIMKHIASRSATTYAGFHIRSGNQTDFYVHKPKAFLTNADIDYMINTAYRNSNPNGKTIRWFISSDSTAVKNRIDAMYPGIIDFYNGTIAHSGGASFKKNNQGTMDAVTEMYLVGHSSQLYVTRGSTFGYIASIIGRLEATSIGLGDAQKFRKH
ncbi:hypothetical protein WA158_001070 [Blastocystis sp. Blastoise]